MTTALISACNEALALVNKGIITALTDGNPEAAECSRFAPHLLAEVAEWTDWPSMIKRETLALLATNPRPAEWLYAYAEPDDLGDIIAIRSVEDDATDLPITGPEAFPRQDEYPLRYIREGGAIYSNVKTATLVYSAKNMTADDWTSHIRHAFVLELAYRLSYPFKCAKALRDDLKRDAEIARARAIAEAENETPQRDTSTISQAEWARAGVEI